MRIASKIVMMLVLAAGLCVFVAGCNNNNKNDSASMGTTGSGQNADHPKSDHPKSDHPEHPSSDHPR